jgi:hypothetical protein
MRTFYGVTMAAALNLALTACATAPEDPTAPSRSAAPIAAGLGIDAPIRELLASPAAVAVLNKDMPGMLSDPRLDMVKSMSLRQVSQYPEANISADKLKLLQADLAAANAPPASASASN